MTDYWVSKLFFDLQHDSKLAAEYRANMAAVLERYEIKADIRKALLEDDDAFSLLLQRFLADHQVPYMLPLYDASGHYLFAAPDKVAVLASALLHTVGKGRDNELFVLLADLLELDDALVLGAMAGETLADGRTGKERPACSCRNAAGNPFSVGLLDMRT